MICFWHGKAISENQRRINGKGRVMARDAYEAFMDSITWVCKANFPKFEGPVSVRLFMVLNRKTDAQAVIKPCLDALELAGVIDNDRQVTHFSYYRETARANQQDSIGIAVTEVRAAGKSDGKSAAAAGVKSSGKRRPHRPGRGGPARLRPAAKPAALKPGA
jgi:Holliday junction resolvase RusA-like endonuclease